MNPSSRFFFYLNKLKEITPLHIQLLNPFHKPTTQQHQGLFIKVNNFTKIRNDFFVDTVLTTQGT